MRWTKLLAAGVVELVLLFTFALAGWASDASLYFASDKNGENKITSVQEGSQVWLCVYDPDEDVDCDTRDKVWTDVKVMDAKTGAHIVWKSYKDKNGDEGGKKFGDDDYIPYKGHSPGPTAGWTGADFLEETAASTGLFVSSRPFTIGTRVAFKNDARQSAHIAGPYNGNSPGAVTPTDFEWGNYLYADSTGDGTGDDRVWVDVKESFVLATDTGKETPPGSAYLPGDNSGSGGSDYVLGRFSNLDTLVGLYVDPDDRSDVALAQAKIIDTRSQISWNKEIYPDGNAAAAVTVVDPDENLNCDAVEYVPVFIIVNPGSWNPVKTDSANNFCALKRYGGVVNINGDVSPDPLEWYNIYDSKNHINLGSSQPNAQGTYYIEYPTAADNNVTSFNTASASGITRIMFYAEEIGANTGVFQFSINSILTDLGFTELRVHDVLAAYYVDPNDQDDVALATAYIGAHEHSVTSFTDEARAGKTEFWLGNDPVYVQVIDSNANTDACCPEQVVVHVCDPHEVDDVEWLILDELSSNSSVFFTNVGMELGSVWNALGNSDIGGKGGYRLRMDNWRLEGFNEDTVYARYNDVTYTGKAMSELGDSNKTTSFPPTILSDRVANDVSFAVMHIADTQVLGGDGETAMYFLDRQGDRLSEYANSDCVFVEVVDKDQDEDQYRRERISAYWDGAQNLPFAPWNYAENHASCGYTDEEVHPVNDLLGDTNVFSSDESQQWPKLYVLNPRNGRFAAFDLLETGVGTGDFVSVTCIDLASQYSCAPSLGVLPGDTLLAVYQDPSNHSDNAWISINVDIGGAAPAQGSSTSFVDADGNDVDAYVAGDPIYVRVFDSSLAGAGTIPDAVTIADTSYNLSPLSGSEAGTFITAAIYLDCAEGETITATYTDPSDPSDTSSDTAVITSAGLTVDRFYAGPSPFSDEVSFSYIGTGLAASLSVAVYDLSGHCVWRGEDENARLLSWDGRSDDGARLANGAYIYIIVAGKGTNTFTGRGTVFIKR